MAILMDIRYLHISPWEETCMVEIDCSFDFLAIFEIEFWVRSECSLLFLRVFDWN